MLLLKGTSEKALVDLINASNSLPVPLDVGDLYYGKPKPIAGGLTHLPVVTQYDNEEYEGYAKFEYRRLNLSVIFRDIRPLMEEVGQNSLVRLLPVVNKKVGLNLQPEDIIDQSIVWLGGNEQANLQFVISPNSLAYEGRLIIQFIRIRPTLQSIIPNRTLDVLQFPDPIVEGLKSLSMDTWGIDYTDDQAALRTYHQGWFYPDRVKAVMERNGFPNFPVGVIGDDKKVALYATKDVPKANKAYSHVIIQKGVTTATHRGDAYFHFNRS